jgi:hypothetical protein
VRGFRILLILCLLGGCVDLTQPPGLRDAGPASSDLHSEGPPSRPDSASDTGSDDMKDDSAANLDAATPDDAPPDREVAPPVDDGPPALLIEGRPCDRAAQCASGFCAQGVCCRTACPGICMACNLASAPGQCAPVPAGEDPLEGCAAEAPSSCGLDGTCNGQGACRRYPAGAECAAGSCTAGTEYAARTCDGNGTCGPGLTSACPAGCSGGSCLSPCNKAADCQPGFFCNARKCTLKRPAASACTKAEQCAAGFCVDGVCCTSACGESCFACNVGASAGTCTPVPSGQDPRTQCPAEAAASCGRAGGCNGAGACRLYAATTPCGSASCNGSIASPAAACDGLGVCRSSGSARDCSPYTCGAGACASSCVDSTTCASGFTCQNNVCAVISGLALFYRFEETTGTSAVDSSGNARNGVYIGSPGAPAPSTDVPPLMYANSRSRAFSRAARHAVQLSSTAVVQAANDLTVSAWYHATSSDTRSSDIVSGWNGYILRVRAGEVEWTKRLGNADYVNCLGNAAGALDGRWHHVAGVFSRALGMKVYFDGVEICSNASRNDVVYAPTADGFFVGRHGDHLDEMDFEGNIDEVRFYTRPLSATEITALAQGRN